MEGGAEVGAEQQVGSLEFAGAPMVKAGLAVAERAGVGMVGAVTVVEARVAVAKGVVE